MQDDMATPDAPRATAPVVRISNADGTTFALLSEWLAGAGYRVVADGPPDEDAGRADIAIVDVPFSRSGGQTLEGVAQRHPGEPIIALSATFLSSVGCGGGCAKRLGVAGVLAKPFTRAALLSAVQRLVPAPPGS